MDTLLQPFLSHLTQLLKANLFILCLSPYRPPLLNPSSLPTYLGLSHASALAGRGGDVNEEKKTVLVGAREGRGKRKLVVAVGGCLCRSSICYVMSCLWCVRLSVSFGNITIKQF